VSSVGYESSFWLLGFCGGLALGLGIGSPPLTDRSALMVQLEREDIRLLKAGELSETMKGRICDRVKLALLEAADNDLDLTFLCPPASR